jgi:hypothetical protein
MDEFWALMELGPASTVSVIRTDGWVVARHPQLQQTLDLSETQLFTKYLPNAASGVYLSAASPADALARIVGYRTVTSWPLVATTGIERTEALQVFWTSMRAAVIIGIPLIALLVLGIFWVVRLLAADEARRIELESALERNNFLLREIHHRVKNNLQAVSSLVRLQALPKESKDDMARRIAAMVAVHEQIYGADQFDRVDFASYAERLVKEVATSFAAKVVIEKHLEQITVEADHALPLGLILNEALSNAFNTRSRGYRMDDS